MTRVNLFVSSRASHASNSSVPITQAGIDQQTIITRQQILRHTPPTFAKPVTEVIDTTWPRQWERGARRSGPRICCRRIYSQVQSSWAWVPQRGFGTTSRSRMIWGSKYNELGYTLYEHTLRPRAKLPPVSALSTNIFSG
jgi:hypothetical protein